MSILTALGLGLALLASDQPKESPPAVVRSTVAAGPRVSTVALAARLLEPRPILRQATQCIQWYYPAPARFSQDPATETFWVAGDSSILKNYDGHPEWVHLTASNVNNPNLWSVISATWNGQTGWLKIVAQHGAVSSPPVVTMPAPQAPSKVLPPVAPSSQSVQVGTGVSGPIDGSLTISLDPTGGSTCSNVYFPCTYLEPTL